MENLDVYAKQLIDAIIGFSPKVILALGVLVFGFCDSMTRVFLYE